MSYEVRIKKKAQKNLGRLSLEVRQLFFRKEYYYRRGVLCWQS